MVFVDARSAAVAVVFVAGVGVGISACGGAIFVAVAATAHRAETVQAGFIVEAVQARLISVGIQAV
jgi:hypothetical protein